MQEEYILIPDTGRKLYDGEVVILNRLPDAKWIVRYGYFTYNKMLMQDWHLCSISGNYIIPLENDDLNDLQIIDSANKRVFTDVILPDVDTAVFTTQDKLMLDRTILSVTSIEELYEIDTSELVDNKKVRVDSVDEEGTVGYYQWNKKANVWEAIPYI